MNLGERGRRFSSNPVVLFSRAIRVPLIHDVILLKRKINVLYARRKISSWITRVDLFTRVIMYLVFSART
jgi:hypothetical protein